MNPELRYDRSSSNAPITPPQEKIFDGVLYHLDGDVYRPYTADELRAKIKHIEQEELRRLTQQLLNSGYRLAQ